MAIQFRCSCKTILIALASLFVFANANFLEDAYKNSVGSKSSLEQSRKNDLVYDYIDPKCCCNSKIMNLFKSETKKFHNRVNPAIDTLIKSLSKEIEYSSLLYKELKNYKVANGIYSFKDLMPVAVDTPYQSPEIPNGDGCVPLDFNKEEDRQYYLNNIINRFESGGDYGNINRQSGAYGRYQFIPSTGAHYCQVVGNGCCDVWHSDTQKGRTCQDAMFQAFTKDNANMLANKGIPTNSCTIYLAHQQGVGGLVWLRGGKSPYKSFNGLKQAIRQNVGKSYQASVDSATTEQELRNIYREFWSKKFGGDILANVGSILPVEKFTYSAYLFNKHIDNIKQFYREGILKEQMKVNYENRKQKK
jgi:hypothetical protein